ETAAGHCHPSVLSLLNRGAETTPASTGAARHRATRPREQPTNSVGGTSGEAGDEGTLPEPG
ncbi:MAG: hypothetical protein ACXWMU_06950, partial [Candidatus Limnocylindrales bacterium]